MAGNTVQFVDSIVSSPTVRLDLNDEVIFAVTNFDAPPPPLRRSLVTNAMRAGAWINSALYDLRTITIDIELVGSSQDNLATALQDLMQELDRPDNYLKYQRVGATKPVFFKTFKSQTDSIQEILAAKAFNTITIEVLAHPFALGLQESGSLTVNNDPANATNGCFFQLSSVVGDTHAPLKLVLSHSTANFNGFTSLLSHTASNYVNGSYTGVYQLKLSEATTKPTITTGDATMSNGDYGRVTHASAGVDQTDFVFNGSQTTYMKGNSTTSVMEPGTYKVLVRLRRNTTAASITLKLFQQFNDVQVGQDTRGVTVSMIGAEIRWVDIGTISVPYGSVPKIDANSFQAYTYPSPYLKIKSQSSVTTGSLDYDSFCFVPVNPVWDTSTTNMFVSSGNVAVTQTIKNLVLEGDAEHIIYTDESVPKVLEMSDPPNVTGGYPFVYPNQLINNYHLFTTYSTGSGATNDSVSQTTTVAWSYYPRYMHVRPVST